MGYCYEEETGFYYVSSRYYDPEVGRFISADTTDILGVSSDLYDKNLYAYCDNNPVMRIDENGDKWEVAGAIIGGAAIVGLDIATAMTGGTAAAGFNIGTGATTIINKLEL